MSHTTHTKSIGTILKDVAKGQHFLTDPRVMDVVTISANDSVIEIGAGSGVITSELAKHAGRVLAFEVDKRYATTLDTLAKSNPNLTIIYDDAFKHSWKHHTKLVSNIPFHVSEQLIRKAIDDRVPELVLLVGDRFKHSLTSGCSAISVIANLRYDIRVVREIDNTHFDPPPRVHAWLVHLRARPPRSHTEALLASILRRRGKLKNALLYTLVQHRHTKNQARAIIQQMNLHAMSLDKPVRAITGRMLTRLTKELEQRERTLSP